MEDKNTHFSPNTSIKNYFKKQYSYIDFKSDTNNNTINYNYNKLLEKVHTFDKLKLSRSERFIETERTRHLLEKPVR